MKKWAFLLTLFFVAAGASSALADGPIIAFGPERQQIRETPILERENRPLHFYGNTVRRRHARQTTAIAPVRPAATPGLRAGR
jgi:hypothetical protein